MDSIATEQAPQQTPNTTLSHNTASNPASVSQTLTLSHLAAPTAAFVHLVAAAAAAASVHNSTLTTQQQQALAKPQTDPHPGNIHDTMVTTPGIVHPLQIGALAHLQHQQPSSANTSGMSALQQQQQQQHITEPKQEPDANSDGGVNGNAKGNKKRKGALNKRKVSHACVYCRRSHMTCDDGRPCQRCIKRKIAHLCHDDYKANATRTNRRRSVPSPTSVITSAPSSAVIHESSDSSSPASTPPPPITAPVMTATTSQPQQTASLSMLDPGLAEDLVGLPSDRDLTATVANALATLDPVTMAPASTSALALDTAFTFASMSAFPPVFASESMGHEFAIISDFLASWDGTFDGTLDPSLVDMDLVDMSAPGSGYATPLGAASSTTSQESLLNGTKLSSAERFILTAADPKDGPSEDRLRSVISAKIEAGLLKPYNYVNGYTRLQKWMDSHMPAPSRQRILNVMGIFRPMFRSVAQSLTDYDLVLVEESFERLLLEYDRVFSSMGIPACLWRRTGEIWKSNKEFASLVGIPIEQLREGKTCIYELMNEDSAVNYWEKYGNIAFDAGQKAVLTSCVLRNPADDTAPDGEGLVRHKGKEVQCCFSFTIRRDRYNIPLLIAGNFLIAS
ncbi:hypothetical protein SpCBS45565_g06753 [Spizellomyces sp. 'palustris']|nr:hypothetical protein SpCBS45565_g06753 [Spizellomyces sp. 'palustris']